MVRLLSLGILLAGMATQAHGAGIQITAGSTEIYKTFTAINPSCHRLQGLAANAPTWMDYHGDEIRFAPTAADVGEHKVLAQCLSYQLVAFSVTRTKVVNGATVTYTVVVTRQVPAKLTAEFVVSVIE